MKKTSLIEALSVLDKYGIKYEIHRGELFVSDAIKVARLCDEGKLPKIICD